MTLPELLRFNLSNLSENDKAFRNSKPNIYIRIPCFKGLSKTFDELQEGLSPDEDYESWSNSETFEEFLKNNLEDAIVDTNFYRFIFDDTTGGKLSFDDLFADDWNSKN